MTAARSHPQAVSLKWDGKGAPKVTAKGHGDVAERIIEIAKQHQIPLSEDKALVSVLSGVELGTEIPPELYVAVAEVIAFAYRLRGKHL